MHYSSPTKYYDCLAAPGHLPLWQAVHQKLPWPLSTFHKVHAHLQKHRGRISNKLVLPTHLFGERHRATQGSNYNAVLPTEKDTSPFCSKDQLVTEAGSATATRLSLWKCVDIRHSFPISPNHTSPNMQERGKSGIIGSSFLGSGWLTFGCISYGSRQQSPKAWQKTVTALLPIAHLSAFYKGMAQSSSGRGRE